MFRTLALGAAPDTWIRLGEGFGSEAVGRTYSIDIPGLVGVAVEELLGRREDRPRPSRGHPFEVRGLLPRCRRRRGRRRSGCIAISEAK